MLRIKILILLLMLGSITQAQILEGQDNDTEEVSEAEVSEALKETLMQSAEESAEELRKEKVTRSTDFFGLDIPAEIRKITNALNEAGLGDLLSQFGFAVDGAVSSIVDGTLQVVEEEINDLTFLDAYKVLKAGNSAATEYLKGETSGEIEKTLRPLVEKSLISSGALDKWSAIKAAYKKTTGEDINFNPVNYLTDEAIDGMFVNMAKEEAKIRVNSYLWGSFIMKRVFKRQIR